MQNINLDSLTFSYIQNINLDDLKFSHILKQLNKYLNLQDTKALIQVIQNDEIIIDKDHYILDCSQIKNLNKINFDLNSINFDIELSHFSDYIDLIHISENNHIISYKIENIDINKLDLHPILIDNIYVLKKLEYKNFNFNLLPNIEINSDEVIDYLINNELYDFLNRDKFDIIKNCNISKFYFFINYLIIDKEYNGNTLYYYIFNGTNEVDKFNILYEDYNLIITDKDILDIFDFIKKNNKISAKIFSYIIKNYSINDICKLNKKSLYILLLKSIFYLMKSIVEKYIQILDLVDNLDINFLIMMMKEKCIISIDNRIFKKIIDKLDIINLSLIDIINKLKENLDVYELFTFFFLYVNKYNYNQDMLNYVTYIFNYKDIQEIEKNVMFTDLCNLIKPLFKDANEEI